MDLPHRLERVALPQGRPYGGPMDESDMAGDSKSGLDAVRQGVSPKGVSPWLIARTRLVLIWEALGPLLVAPACAAAFVLACAWFGACDTLAGPWSLAALGLAGLAILMSAVGLRRLALPGKRAILRRLDERAQTPHRPATALDDAPAHAPGDSVSRPLWDAHLERARQTAHGFPLGPPRPTLAA